MRVAALGGSGAMGRKAVQTLLVETEVEEVLVADLDLERSEAFVREEGDGRLRPVAVDLLEEEATADLLADVDVVMNAAGPFFRLGVPAVRAAIAAGKPYADICDDHRPTLEILELDEQARAVGVPVVIGIGASPGITNLLARKACAELDEVDHVQTVWGGVGGTPQRRRATDTEPSRVRPPTPIVHFLYSVSGTVPIWRDNGLVEETPLTYREDVVFPNGVGTFRLIGHPEPVTIPRFIPRVRSCVNLFGDSLETYDVLEELAPRVTRGELTVEEAARLFVVERQRRVEQRLVGLDRGPRLGDSLHASAVGRANGRRMLVAYGTSAHPRGRMAGATGVPLAIAAGMLLRGEIDEVGVLAPEACIDPDVFFARYAAHCPDLGPGQDVLYEVRREDE